MAHALPVVITPVGGIPDLVRDPDHGRFVAPDDPEGLADALAGLLADPTSARAAGAAARAEVEALRRPDRGRPPRTLLRSHPGGVATRVIDGTSAVPMLEAAGWTTSSPGPADAIRCAGDRCSGSRIPPAAPCRARSWWTRAAAPSPRPPSAHGANAASRRCATSGTARTGSIPSPPRSTAPRAGVSRGPS